jgi:glycosyltransferase involved in cell wall biosynthesis
MNIIWFSWKDIAHPESGGAETVSEEIRKNLLKDGHQVKLITAKYSGSKDYEKRNDGLEIYRSGNRFSVYLKAGSLYKKNFKSWADVVIDEMNTIPFMTPLYTEKNTKNFLLTYQLARQVWFYQMIFPISLIGYLVEPLMLIFMSKLRYKNVLTESNSTKLDLQKYGFKKVHVFRIGMSLEPLKSLGPKKISNSILSLGAIRPMKRTLHAVKAFELARDKNNDLTLTIAGDNSTPYAKKVIKYINNSRHKEAIDVKGRVPAKERLELMTKSDVILVTSIKEGWGLIVTEANSQGTPAIVYDTDGLRDSVKNNITGLTSMAGSYKNMSTKILELLDDDKMYKGIRQKAWEDSKQYTFENSYYDFLKAIEEK